MAELGTKKRTQETSIFDKNHSLGITYTENRSEYLLFFMKFHCTIVFQ